MLLDNFTYTVFGFGSLTDGELVRIMYTVLLAVMAGVAGWRLYEWRLRAVPGRRSVPGVVCLVLVWVAPWVVVAATGQEQQRADDLPPLSARMPAAGAVRPNVLIIGVDGIDAQALSAYGYERATTPFLESLSEQSLFFENAFSNADRTHGSLVTLLTGRLPFETRVTFPPTALQGEDARRNLAMILKERGYATVQLGMRHYADANDMNLTGFDAVNYRWRFAEGAASGPALADETRVFQGQVADRLHQRLGRLLGLEQTADAFAEVQGRKQVPAWRDERRVATLEAHFQRAAEPWFVHLHLLDTHCCEVRPRERYFASGLRELDLRDSQIRETDGQLRRLFVRLADTGLLERTIVVVTSDHGAHWIATERVPLMIRFPNAEPRGRVQANVQLADVAPTVLDYLGAAIPDWMSGLSLLDPGRIPPDRDLFGVSNVLAWKGEVPSLVLRQVGPPNYGAAAVMMIRGDRWFDLKLASGALAFGRVSGHTRPDGRPVSTQDARHAIQAVLDRTGFQIGIDGVEAPKP